MIEAQRTSSPASPLAIPLVVWLLIQLAAIALAASGVQLSASFPRPPQSLAVPEMVVAQFVGAAIFLPVLFRGWQSWLAMVLTAGPMLLVASRIAPLPMTRVLLLWAEVAAWLTALAIWRAAMPRRTDVIAAAAVLLSVGGLVFWYLRAEFQPARDLGPLGMLPLVSSLRRLHDSGGSDPPLPSTLVLAVAGLIIIAAKSVVCREITQPPQS